VGRDAKMGRKMHFWVTKQIRLTNRYKCFFKLYMKTKSGPAVNLFLLYFYGNIVFHVVSYLLGCLVELSNDIN